MRPEDLPEERLPIGESPRWITIHALGGVAAFLLVVGLYALPQDARPTVRWIHAVVPVLLMASLAAGYARRRRRMTPIEVGYLRTAIVVLAVIGIPGALPLSLVAGVVFFAWTVVEKRRQER